MIRQVSWWTAVVSALVLGACSDDTPSVDSGPTQDASVVDGKVSTADRGLDLQVDLAIDDLALPSDAPLADAPLADAPVADAPVADAPLADASPTDISVDQPSPDSAGDQGSDATATLPPNSICSLPALTGQLYLLGEDGGNISAPPNDKAYAVFKTLTPDYQLDHPVTYLVALVPDDGDVQLAKTIGHPAGAYWSAIEGVAVVAVPASAFGIGPASVDVPRVAGSGPFRVWIFAYVGTSAGDRPPAIHPDDIDTVCNAACGTHSPLASAPVTQTVDSLKFDVPADEESADISMPAGHRFALELSCPGSQAPNRSVAIHTNTQSALISKGPNLFLFTHAGGLLDVSYTDAGTDQTPYTCTLETLDYGPDDRDVVISVDDSVLSGSCKLTRAFDVEKDEQHLRIIQPRGMGYYATFTPLDGATITVEPVESTGDRDAFNFTTATAHTVAHNPSYEILSLHITSDTFPARVSVDITRGPIDEDGNLSSIYSVPELPLATPTSGQLFGRDLDFFRVTIVQGHLYEVSLTPTSSSDDLRLNLSDPAGQISAPAVVQTGGAGVAEKKRVLASAAGSFRIEIDDHQGLVTLSSPVGYTVEVADLGPE